MFYMMSDHLQEAYKSIYQRKELVSPPKDAEGTQGIMNPQGTPKAAQGGDHARQEVTKGRYRAAYEEYKQELRDYHIEKFIGWVESLGENGYDISKWELSELSETYIRENNLQGSEEIITEALSGERYKKVMKKPGGTAYSRKVSADPAKRAKRGGKGGESDFGAGDRGSGNKAARRAGTYQEYQEDFEVEVEEGYKPIDKKKETAMYRRAGNLARTSLASKGKKKEDAQNKSAKIVSAITRQKEDERFSKMADHKARDNYKEEVEQVDENRRAARAAGGSKDDSKKQPDPSKDGFTGIGNMSIDQIRKMSARIEKEKTKKEDVEQYVDFLIDEGYDCSELTWEDMFEEYESLDEGLRSAVKRLLGKKEAPAEKKPESRGEQLRKKYNVGPEKSDTSAKRQILDRTRAKKERDQKEYGGSHYSKSVAKKSADAHDRYLRAGYSKYGAGDARGKGNKARKRAEALKKESFSDWRSEIGLSEEASDRNKDERLMRGGVDGNTNYRKSPARKLSNAELGIKPGKTAVQKELEKKHGKGATAMDIVKSEIRAKYGKKSIKD